MENALPEPPEPPLLWGIAINSDHEWSPIGHDINKSMVEVYNGDYKTYWISLFTAFRYLRYRYIMSANLPQEDRNRLRLAAWFNLIVRYESKEKRLRDRDDVCSYENLPRLSPRTFRKYAEATVANLVGDGFVLLGKKTYARTGTNTLITLEWFRVELVRDFRAMLRGDIPGPTRPATPVHISVDDSDDDPPPHPTTLSAPNPATLSAAGSIATLVLRTKPLDDANSVIRPTPRPAPTLRLVFLPKKASAEKANSESDDDYQPSDSGMDWEEEESSNEPLQQQTPPVEESEESQVDQNNDDEEQEEAEKVELQELLAAMEGKSFDREDLEDVEGLIPRLSWGDMEEDGQVQWYR